MCSTVRKQHSVVVVMQGGKCKCIEGRPSPAGFGPDRRHHEAAAKDCNLLDAESQVEAYFRETSVHGLRYFHLSSAVHAVQIKRL